MTVKSLKFIDKIYYIGCGMASDVDRLIELYLSGASEAHKFECDVLMSNGDGHLYRIDVDETGPFKINVSMYAPAALGSGADFAVAAMDFGKTPVQAVKYAITRDSMTGGKVRYFKLSR